jgi:DNA primase
MQKPPAGIDLDTLKRAISITDLAKTLGLQVKGKQARCFNSSRHKHADKSPSLGLDLETNRFKCFACGVSGSIIDLYKEVKGVEVSQAIRELADMAGLRKDTKTYEKGTKRHILSPATKGEKVRKGKIIPQPQNRATSAIYEDLRGYCGELDTQSLAYLTGASRELTKETIARFRLFAIKDYSATNKFMQGKFSFEQLQGAGLVSEAGNLIFYQHKIITPFYANGEIVFLQGRRTDQEQPRYMHLKRQVPLFNIDTLRGIKVGGKVYICEGVFDAMMLEQEGFKAVAILGVNNFKPEMSQLFKGLEVVLCLDNDEGGRQGTKALARLFLLNGQSVKTKVLPDGVKDITEYFIK